LDVFARADKLKLAASMLLVVVVWLLDAFKLSALTRAAGDRIDYKFALELTWINYFGSAITPMQSGGGPFQMYMMYQKGISVGASVAITLVRTLLVMLILGLMIPFSLMMKLDLPHFGWGARGFIFYVVLFCTLAWLCVILSLVRPRLIKKFCVLAVNFLRRVGLLRQNMVSRAIKRACREIDAYNENLWAFMTSGRRYFLLGSAIAFLQILVQLSVMPCMIWAVGEPVHYVECVLIQALFLFVLYFIPTPGGSGAAEGGAALVLSLFVPWNVAGMLGVGWRFLTEYTGIFLGAVVALKTMGWALANQIISSEGKDGGGGKNA
jgi:uncharacterized protein (TIRG00374 family)